MKKCPSPTGFFKIDNLFEELLTEYLKTIARRNLGIADDNNLYWGNIKGLLENQIDLKSFINNKVKKETKNQISELLKILLNVLELIKALDTWANEGGDIQALATNISLNTVNIQKLLNRVVYLTENEYNELIKEGLVEDDVEYNIYEEDETI